MLWFGIVILAGIMKGYFKIILRFLIITELFASKKRSPSYLQVITGRGSHSRDGKARIKPAVVEYLKRNEYRWDMIIAQCDISDYPLSCMSKGNPR